MEEASKSPELSVDLSAKLETIRAFATTHNLLVAGSYSHNQFQDVHKCVQFIRSCHEAALEDAKKHPDAHLVPDLNVKKD